MNIATFFREEQIDAFAVVSTGCLAEKDQEDVLQFFPQARSVIVFGKEVPATVYRMPKKGKTQGMLRIAEHLDEVAIRLADHMNDENIPAKAVPLYLPIKVVDGKVQGVVRLKHLAATGGLGSVGKSAILLNLRYGPRLFLSGVVSGLSIEEYDNEDRAGLHSGCSNLCSGCNRCAQVCPERAIGQAGVDVSVAGR